MPINDHKSILGISDTMRQTNQQAKTRPNRKTTLKDVADYCGVSAMTVSRILNNKDLVSKATAAKIRRAVRELNYTPNLLAKSLRVNRTRTFGMVASDSTEFLFGKMTKGIVDAAAEADYSVIIANTNQNPDLEKKAIKTLLDKRIDGLLLCAPYTLRQEEILAIRDTGIPVALLMRTGGDSIDYINSDNKRAAYEITNYMLDQGAEEIHFVNLPRTHPNGEERRAGNRQALEERGLTYDDRITLFVANPHIEDGYQAMRTFISRGVRRGAMVCGSDILAIGAIKAALDAGIDIPGDMRVCGFDDIEMLDMLKVPLTTMRQQVYEMGRRGVELLLRRQEGKKGEPVHTRLACELVVRESA